MSTTPIPMEDDYDVPYVVSVIGSFLPDRTRLIADWRVGVASDPLERLLREHHVVCGELALLDAENENLDYWDTGVFVRQEEWLLFKLEDEQMSVDVERETFHKYRRYGLNGHEGGRTDERTLFVYVIPEKYAQCPD